MEVRQLKKSGLVGINNLKQTKWLVFMTTALLNLYLKGEELKQKQYSGIQQTMRDIRVSLSLKSKFCVFVFNLKN